MIDAAIAAVVVTALGAAVVNGALGYGFSSLTVPIALAFIGARTLVPALVVIEVALNLHQLWLNRAAAPRVAPRVAPLLVGLVPGVALGALALHRVGPDALKVATYAVLLPIAIAQAIGFRRPFARERAVALPLGVGVGALYATTTISGPPLAMFLGNQGLTRHDFRAALALIRAAEATFTLVALLALGQLHAPALALAGWLVPAVAIGAPLGHHLAGAIDATTFRQVAMSFDAGVVAVGLARALVAVGVAALVVYPGAAAIAGMALGFTAATVLGRAAPARTAVEST